MGQAAIQSWSLWSLGLLLVGRIVLSHALDRMDARGRFELHPFSDAEQEGGTCTPSSLWGKEVAAMQLEIGCKEVKALLDGNTVLAGEGRLRDVYLGQYKGRTVAIKVLKEAVIKHGKLKLRQQQQWEQRRDLQQWMEAVAMDTAGGANVVRVLGACNNTVITEAYSDTLETAIARRTDTPPIRAIIAMCVDAARGLHALHDFPAAPIVHFDIKPSQFLLANGRNMPNGGHHVKLNDFNLAWFMSTRPDGSPCKFSSNGWQWEIPLQAPEFRLGQPLDEKVDIFALAWIFYAMINGGLPFGLDDFESQQRFMQNTGGIPEFNSTWHSGFVEVIGDMFSVEPEQRPSARQIVVRLEAILSELPEP